MGVVVNNGIVLLDHMNQLRQGGMGREDAILQAGRDRLRAILMTPPPPFSACFPWPPEARGWRALLLPARRSP